jgi:hypothetical protein
VGDTFPEPSSNEGQLVLTPSLLKLQTALSELQLGLPRIKPSASSLQVGRVAVCILLSPAKPPQRGPKNSQAHSSAWPADSSTHKNQEFLIVIRTLDLASRKPRIQTPGLQKTKTKKIHLSALLGETTLARVPIW